VIKVLRTVAVVGSFALAIGAGVTAVLAQDDTTVMGGSSGSSTAEGSAPVIAGGGQMSVDELTDAILAQVMQGITIPASRAPDIDEPADDSTIVGGSRGGNINVGGSSGGNIMVGGSSGGGVTLGGGPME
jgi:hypothetical protein